MTHQDADVTALLEAWRRGEQDALGRLMELVHAELRTIARRLFRGERESHTLEPTALVHELYLRFEKQRRVSFHNRAELFAVAARLMRRVLVDHARSHRAERRGGGVVHLTLDAGAGLHAQISPAIEALDDALIDLERRSPRQSRIVEMRLLVGLSLEEIAAVEQVSLSTVSRDWKVARLFLLRQLSASGAGGE